MTKASCELEGETVVVYIGSRIVWEDSLNGTHEQNYNRLRKANTFTERYNRLMEPYEGEAGI